MRRPSVSALLVVFLGRRLARKPYSFEGHLAFGYPAVLRYLFHHVTVAVTCGEIHLAVNFSRVLTQHPFDRAHPLDELGPINRSQKAEAADAVAYGNLVCGLLLVFRMHQLLD